MIFYSTERKKFDAGTTFILGMNFTVKFCVQVLRGNTSDNKAVVEQVHKVINQFGVKRSIFVGDRGMLKSPQAKQIADIIRHITAITTAQIRTLMKKGIISLDMFKNQQVHTLQFLFMRS